eukprot:Tamp_11083.p1 GENE.Tamp_11083~~Tamp_11083.p1  ORF type:complete len:154 (-),score=18.03 Tamp_11083:788-1249(-)
MPDMRARSLHCNLHRHNGECPEESTCEAFDDSGRVCVEVDNGCMSQGPAPLSLSLSHNACMSHGPAPLSTLLTAASCHSLVDSLVCIRVLVHDLIPDERAAHDQRHGLLLQRAMHLPHHLCPGGARMRVAGGRRGCSMPQLARCRARALYRHA